MPEALISVPLAAARSRAVSTRCRRGAQAGHADADRAVLADDGDGLVDAGPVSRGEVGDIAFDAADELPDDGDLLVGGGCLVACPGVDAGDSGEPFAGAEQ